MIEGSFERVAADVVKKDIPLIRAGFGNLLIQVTLLVIDSGVQPGHFGQPLAFLRATRDADNTAPFYLGNLTGNRARGTGST